MKKLIFISIIMSISNIFGQNISISTNEIDPFSKQKVIQTAFHERSLPRKKDKIDQDNRVLFSLSYIENKEGEGIYTLGFLLSPIDYVCLSEYDGFAMLLLENDESIKLVQNSKTNCNSFPSANYIFSDTRQISKSQLSKNSKQQLEQITNSSVNLIRIMTSKGYMDFPVKKQRQNFIKEHFDAVNRVL